MDAPVVTNNDTGTPRTEDESEVEIQENTPSVRQEVNKPSDDDAEPGLTLKCDKTIETETENNVSYTKMDSQKGSPNKKMRKVVFPVEPVHSYLDPPDPWRNGKYIYYYCSCMYLSNTCWNVVLQDEPLRIAKHMRIPVQALSNKCLWIQISSWKLRMDPFL